MAELNNTAIVITFVTQTFLGCLKIATNGSVLPKAGYSVLCQPIPKLIYFLLPKIIFVA